MSSLRIITSSALTFARPQLRPSNAPLRSFHVSASRSEHFLDATPKVFEERVRNGGDKPVLVDFYADWCQPCKLLSPLLEKVTTDATLVGGVEVDLLTVDTDSQIELAQEYGIRSLPTVIAFKNGEQVDQFIGLQRIDGLKRFVQGL